MRAYTGGGLTDWFLPSKDELNAMYTYSMVGGFKAATYGFASDTYWSSSQSSVGDAWYQDLGNGIANNATKNDTVRVRPVRTF